jgi:hypothetical protein
MKNTALGDENYRLHPIDFEIRFLVSSSIMGGIKLLLSDLFSSIVLTTPEYVQCKNCEQPDEFSSLFFLQE